MATAKMQNYKITSWINDELVIKKCMLAQLLGDEVVKPLHLDWLGRFCIIMQRKS